MVRRVVCGSSVVSCWRSIALRLVLVRRGVYRPSAVFLLDFYCRAVVLVRRGVYRPSVVRSCRSAGSLLPCG